MGELEVIKIKGDTKEQVSKGNAKNQWRNKAREEECKLGAYHYLAKPANTEDIIAAFNSTEGKADVDISPNRTSLKNVEWEKIHQTLVETDFNISETARRLGMHRRTLARKLEKRQIK